MHFGNFSTLASKEGIECWFSQFVGILQIIKQDLDASGLNYCYLDGSSKDRMAQVDRFQENDSIPVFLISLKAGGTGLNLTAADIVVHFDPWWNPAVEAQASDRAHRIGQDKQVTIYKLTSGTVEENVLQMQKGTEAYWNKFSKKPKWQIRH